jgi:hypothetical protein
MCFTKLETFPANVLHLLNLHFYWVVMIISSVESLYHAIQFISVHEDSMAVKSTDKMQIETTYVGEICAEWLVEIFLS